eukprot:TRINITY_DN2866_c0_g1_i2.p2 TRINITY_DN2866_c0_g1~~TRINITY_DN2866_c0_g1_i2.p2  ORF type:complete len:110 (+),score=27.00 TRINITY_DN2866_c0_g1_i2:51-380(+)
MEAKRKREDEIKEKNARKIVILTCGEKGHEALCGAEAAKGGTEEVVGATVLWLVCENITRCVGRLESFNGVTVLQEWVDGSEEAKKLLNHSHKEYEKNSFAGISSREKG